MLVGRFQSWWGTIGRLLGWRWTVGRLRLVIREETFLSVDLLLSRNVDQFWLTRGDGLLATLLPLEVLAVVPGLGNTVGRVLDLTSRYKVTRDQRLPVPTSQVKVCVFSVLLTSCGS